MGKGDMYRPALTSREEQELRWKYFKGEFKGTPEEFNKRIAEIRERTGKP